MRWHGSVAERGETREELEAEGAYASGAAPMKDGPPHQPGLPGRQPPIGAAPRQDRERQRGVLCGVGGCGQPHGVHQLEG